MYIRHPVSCASITSHILLLVLINAPISPLIARSPLFLLSDNALYALRCYHARCFLRRLTIHRTQKYLHIHSHLFTYNCLHLSFAFFYRLCNKNIDIEPSELL
ncbi:hypothetical protein K435DRAFT_63037 [Dendrothele bispora CBS 962.96]|uniref:Uncharacterized protein n=1 Tax=Dendrothele bispora (strain CBS 962.96) TaxID=1314807 RepID=A0A4S8M5I7_DENBC|nr:hypothetical protein K435DRAFT_63037 [Dendrothele bispora CBS 962.96]